MKVSFDISLPVFDFRRWWDTHTDNNWAIIGATYDPFFGIKRHIKDFLRIECMWERHFGIFDKWERIETTKEYALFQCPRCKAIKKVFWNHSHIEFVPQRVKEERAAFFKSTVQPWRSGEPSREFMEAYPDKAKKLFSKKEQENARYVWKGEAGWNHREKTY